MLYKKYRPKTFEDVVGQDVTKTILQNEIKNNTLPTAMLFIGAAGVSKTTCAKILANEINAEVLEVDSASHGGVDDVKKIIEECKLAPLSHTYKLVIFDEAHMLTKQSWASLLIPLEQHIPHLIIIFCTTDAQRIPDTIFSRAQRFNFTKLTVKQIANQLLKVCKLENIKIERDAILTIAQKSNGNMRMALSYLEKCTEYTDDITLEKCELALNLASTKNIDMYLDTIGTNKALEVLKELNNKGISLELFIKSCIERASLRVLQNTLDKKVLKWLLQLNSYDYYYLVAQTICY